MSKARIAGRVPTAVELEPGEYHWCACGRSPSQPFCDGSHRGTGIVPLAFTVDAAETGHLCMCKQTGNPPYCDGSHASLPEDAIEVEAKGQSAGDGAPAAKNTPEEPSLEFIHMLARDGLSKTGHHGPMGAMGRAAAVAAELG